MKHEIVIAISLARLLEELPKFYCVYRNDFGFLVNQIVNDNGDELTFVSGDVDLDMALVLALVKLEEMKK